MLRCEQCFGRGPPQPRPAAINRGLHLRRTDGTPRDRAAARDLSPGRRAAAEDWPGACTGEVMRLRTQPQLFARVFVDALTTRPLLHALLEQRRIREASPDEPVAALVPDILASTPMSPPLPEAA